MIKRTLFLLPAVLLCSLCSWAQTVYTGTIVDATNNEPLIGASVLQKGTSNGTITDLDGNFSLALKDGEHVLTISYIGYDTKNLQVGDQTMLHIALALQSTKLDEVVVVGYGTQKAKDLTAPIAVVKGDELSRQTTSNATQALQGKVAGVQVISDGTPGSGGTVKIRGVGSIGDYAKPLYIVDGIFVDNIDFISPSDIADLTILKDASSAAIYGVRAANGVILVTTKRGTSERPTVSYEGYAAMQVPVNLMKLASASQYVDLINEANTNTAGYIPKNITDYPANTDWYDELTKQAALMHAHNIDISGRTAKSNYSFGGNYLYQDGIMETTNNYGRMNLRARYEQEVFSWLKISANTVFSRATTNSPNTSAYFQAFVNPPVYNVYDATNTEAYPEGFGSPQDYGFGNSYGNPYAAAFYQQKKVKTNKLIFNVSADFNIIKNKLTFRTSYNQDIDHADTRDYQPAFLVGGSQSASKSQLTKTSQLITNQIIDNLLTWRDQQGGHAYSVMVGQSTRMYLLQSLSGYGLGAPGYDDQAMYLTNTMISGRNTYDSGTRYNGVSAFARATYNYDGRYLASLTFRADGSSKYQQKWGYFPSIGLGWIMSDEPWMKQQRAFQYIKLRASWGMLGNDNVPSNSSVTLGTTGVGSSGIFGDALVTGQGALTVLRNYLKWEVVNEFDIGADFATANNRLSGELDYYRRVTNNVVFEAPIASGGGSATLLGNNGSVLNTGAELSLRWADKVGSFNYHVGMNLTTVHNEVLSLNNRDYIPGALVRGSYTTRTAVGHAIGSFYGYEVAGVYQSDGDALRDPVSQTIKETGYFKYKDQNGDNVIDENDKVYLGSAIPWLMGGVDFGFEYKNFDFALALQGQVGNKVLNAKRMNRDVFADGNYDLDFYENCFRPNRLSNTYPSAEAYSSSFIQQCNSFFVENAAYLRIQNITAGYTFRPNKGVQSVRIYATAQNPYTIFGYNGFTPEVSGSPTESGIDTSVYPLQGTYSLGVKVIF